MTTEQPLRNESGLTPVPDPDGRTASTVEAESMAIREGVPQVVRGDVQQPAVPRQRALPASPDVSVATKAARPVRLLPQIAVVAAAVAVYFLVRGATNS